MHHRPERLWKDHLCQAPDGLLTTTQGDVRVKGMSIKDSSDLHRIRQLVGMVFQNPDNQIVGMTVEEDVALLILTCAMGMEVGGRYVLSNGFG